MFHEFGKSFGAHVLKTLASAQNVSSGFSEEICTDRMWASIAPEELQECSVPTADDVWLLAANPDRTVPS